MKHLFSYRRIVLSAVFCGLILISGCVSIPLNEVKIPSSFMQKKGKIGIIWVKKDEKPTADFYQTGRQGLLDIGINHLISTTLRQRLQKEELDPLIKKFYLTPFSEAFSLDGFEIKTIDSGYDLKKYKEISDQKQIAKEVEVDHLIILEILSFGIGRSYFGIIPTSQPQGLTNLRCYLINSSSDQIIAQHIAKNLEASQGEWDEPPEYPNLMKAMLSSFEKSIDECFFAFFGRLP